MGKRKELPEGDVTMRDGSPDGEDPEDRELVDVEFEWFDPQPAVDFHGIKHLLRQLFDTDSQLFDLSALSDLILSQPLLGSTVKVDGNETDPYAFLSVINLQEHKDKPAVKDLISYLQKKGTSNPSFSALAELFSKPTIPPIGLILTERLINMPPEVVPPMYTMLQEEIAWALAENEPYQFTHYLILSKTYEEVASQLDQEESRPQKKKKQQDKPEELFYFHAEDEVFERHSLCHGSYNYTKPQDEGASDSKRAFQELGIRPKGHLMLIEASKFAGAVQAIVDYLKPQE